MQALRALVIFMGVLIVLGMGFLVYGLMTGAGHDEEGKTAAAPPFGLVESALPDGASVASVTVDNGRAIVELSLADGGAELRIFDIATGALHGTVRLKAMP